MDSFKSKLLKQNHFTIPSRRWVIDERSRDYRTLPNTLGRLMIDLRVRKRVALCSSAFPPICAIYGFVTTQSFPEIAFFQKQNLV
jgi:hypothetical protein